MNCRILVSALIGFALAVATFQMKAGGPASEHYDLRLNGQSTGLADKLDISGCFDMGDMLGAVHFDNDGIVFSQNGKDAGVYKVLGDTICAEIYRQWGGPIKRYAKIVCDFLVLNRGSVRLISFRLPSSTNGDGYVRLDNKPTVFTHYDCPANFKPNYKFIRNRKSLWSSEEARKRWMEQHN